MKKRVWTGPLWITIVSVLVIAFLILVAAKAFTVNSSFRIDSLVGIGFILFIYFRYRNLGIRGWILPLIFLVVLLNIFGFFGAYNLMLFGLGYDKYLHLFAGFVITIALFQIFESKENYVVLQSPLLRAFVMMLGIMALGEILEFVGSVYLGVSEGFLATAGSAASNSASDMVRYDTMWDLIFDVFGGILAAITAILIGKRV